MSMISEMEAEAAAKREREVVAWAAKCGACDGMEAAIDLVLLEAESIFAHATNEGQVDTARIVRKLGEKLQKAKMAIMRDLPATPQPSPDTEHIK